MEEKNLCQEVIVKNEISFQQIVDGTYKFIFNYGEIRGRGEPILPRNKFEDLEREVAQLISDTEK